MKQNRAICVAFSMILLISSAISMAEEAVWLDNFEAAKAEAAKRGVPILADFSGSDWCGWCKKLDREVFSTAELAAYAKENLVLFVADFPSKKKLAEATVAQNKELQKEYKIQGFPTVLLLDAKGKVIARTGYKPGGASVYIEHLNDLLKQAAAAR